MTISEIKIKVSDEKNQFNDEQMDKICSVLDGVNFRHIVNQVLRDAGIEGPR